MAFLAEWFPVALIPKQPLVAAMRDDVIHHGCRNDLSLRLTEGAQRMLFQEKAPGLTPAGIIPASVRAAAQAVTAPRHMILTEHLTLFAKARTSGIAAGSSWFLGHFAPPTAQ
jgi:hypothetical protein